MLGKPDSSINAEGDGRGQLLKSAKRDEERQSLWETGTRRDEDTSPEDAQITGTATGKNTMRVSRKLSCLGLRFRKYFRQLSGNAVQTGSSGEKVFHNIAYNKSQRVEGGRTQKARERIDPFERPVMGIMEDIKAWLKPSQSKRPRKPIEPYRAQHSSVIPIRTSTSRCQPLPGSGAAARQSAAARNSRLSQCPAEDAFNFIPEYPPSYQKTDPRSGLLGQTLTQDGESGVNLDTHQHSLGIKDDMHPIIRKGMSSQLCEPDRADYAQQILLYICPLSLRQQFFLILML